MTDEADRSYSEVAQTLALHAEGIYTLSATLLYIADTIYLAKPDPVGIFTSHGSHILS